MTEANNMRKYLEVLNERAPEVPYIGKHIDNPEVAYDSESKGGEITKVIARLQANWSGKYTKLGRNLLRIERINARIEQLKEEVKQDTRGMIADLFHADDACRTREVETVSFLFKITADPKAAETYKYKEVLEALEQHLTPELRKKKEELMAQFKQINKPKPASIRVATDKAEESLEEAGLGDMWKSIKAACRKFYSTMLAWGSNYDAELDMLKAKVQMNEGGVQPHADMDSHRGHADVKWGSLLGKPMNLLRKGKEKKAYHQHVQRKRNKDYIRHHDAHEGIEESNPLIETDAQDPRHTGQEVSYRGWIIGYDSEAALYHGTGYYIHPEGWQPGDPHYYNVDEFQDAKEAVDEEIEAAEAPQEAVEEDGDWHSQDDFQDYNDAEADDYRHDFDDEPSIDPDLTTYSPEDAVHTVCEILGIGSANGGNIDPANAEAVYSLVNALSKYSDIYSIAPTQNDQAYEFDVADTDNVNHHYNPMATAWIENGRFVWKED
jgi:hypothetical protein